MKGSTACISLGLLSYTLQSSIFISLILCWSANVMFKVATISMHKNLNIVLY